jgi:hypothetical protein
MHLCPSQDHIARGGVLNPQLLVLNAEERVSVAPEVENLDRFRRSLTDEQGSLPTL